MSQEINEQETTEKPKRTRRTAATRKKAETTAATAEKSESAEVEVKAAAAEEAGNSAPADGEIVEKPKRRTRRTTAKSAATEEDKNAEAESKPRRTVRRKKVESEAAPEAAPATEQAETPATDSTGGSEAAEEKAKPAKTTTRKTVRRTRKSVVAEQVSLLTPEEAKPAEEVKAEAKEDEAAAKPAEKTAEQPAVEVKSPVRRRRTTARAEAPVTKSALKEAAEANAAEAAAEAAAREAARSETTPAKAEAEAVQEAPQEDTMKQEDAAEPGNEAPARDEKPLSDDDRQPVFFYEDDSVVTNILPPLDEQEQNFGNRNFRSNAFGKSYNDRRRGGKNRRQPKGQPYAQDFPLLSGPMSYDDMPPMSAYGNAPDGNKRSPRSRKRHSVPNGNTFDPYTQPAFTPPYPGYDPQYEDPDAILPLAQQMLNGQSDNLADDFEDDGPQPALPGQPSLALPPSDEEIDLAALDEAVNGNRIQPHQHSRPQERHNNERKNRRDARHDARAEVRNTELMVQEDRKEEPDEENNMPTLPPGTKRVLYVSVVPDEQVEVVITDNGLVTEYFVEMAHQAKIRGNIYKGVINNVDINLQAAFVNFGGGKNGFLQIDEVHPEYWLSHHDASHGSPYPPIQKVLKNGQEVLVQVVKEPAGTKGAFLTTWISLAGRYLVLTPGQEQIGVSRKVEDNEERSRLKELLAGIDPGEDMGVIIRTASEGASKTSIQKDLQYLKRLWKDIRKKGMTEKAPALIYQEADLATRAVRDYLTTDIHEIWVDDVATQASISEMTNLLFPRRNDLVKLHQDPRQTLWERFNLQRQLEEVTSREVVLPSGGRLVFDQTEALMAIDINSGKTQGKSNFESMVFRTNMEAAEAIARHLRLRDIGGQVVIDFIEMRDRSHGREVEKALRNAMRMDRARHDVGRMSSFGLLELVRQRTGTSAISISTEPCPFCHGTGVRRNMEWQALQTLRDIQRKLAKLAAQEEGRKRDKNAEKPAHLTYDCDFELGMYLLNKKRDRLCELETKYNCHVEITLKH